MSSNSCICYHHQQSLSDRRKFENILQLYNNDLPCPLSFDSELDLWQHKWSSEPQLASELNTPEKCLAHTDSDFFPNIHVLLRIMASLPVTSMLKLVKSPLRSSMGKDRLNVGNAEVSSRCGTKPRGSCTRVRPSPSTSDVARLIGHVSLFLI